MFDLERNISPGTFPDGGLDHPEEDVRADGSLVGLVQYHPAVPED